MKKITILGSTGSIGVQALEIIAGNPEQFLIEGLSCGENIELLKIQAKKFRPKVLCVAREEDALSLMGELSGTEILWGDRGLEQLARGIDSEMVLNSLVGICGLAPTLAAISAGKDVALANKEALVTGGGLVMDAVKEYGVRLLPVDSEHSAIFQCLEGNRDREIREILLTASGGPFRGYSSEQLEKVTLEQALRHPNWNMGGKITIDSATLMNKGLEVIEAYWLFGVSPEQIRVLVHPQSVIHSMVEFMDHAIVAQLGRPDMKAPISFALSWPDRLPNDDRPLDFLELRRLTFEDVDRKVFKCLDLACRALALGDSYPVVLNGANEALVAAFRRGKIRFVDIANKIEEALEAHTPVKGPGLQDILAIDREVRGKLEIC